MSGVIKSVELGDNGVERRANDEDGACVDGVVGLSRKLVRLDDDHGPVTQTLSRKTILLQIRIPVDGASVQPWKTRTIQEVSWE